MWYWVLFWLFVFTLVTAVSSFASWVGIAFLAALFASACVILFYWYSYRIYVSYIKESFDKAFYSMLTEPLSKPRPTLGGMNQSANLYALGASLFDRKSKLVKSLDLGALLHHKGFDTQRGLSSPEGRKIHTSHVVKSPASP